jgi:hypothetical protein
MLCRTAVAALPHRLASSIPLEGREAGRKERMKEGNMISAERNGREN